MAFDLSLHGTVTRRQLDDAGYEYFFPLVVITTNTNDDTMHVESRIDGTSYQVRYADITTNHGATNIQEYVDYIATNGYYA